MPNTSAWKQVTVGELGEELTGRTPPSSDPELFGAEYPFITPTDIRDDDVHVQAERFLSRKGFESQKRILLPPDTVCFVCIGATIGKICLTDRPSFTNQQINSIVVDKSQHDARFVFHLLRFNAPRVKGVAGGAATPIVNKTAFSAINVRVPELPAQKRIGAIFGAHDDLIENNTRRIKILEQMAQMLYREWFINFRFPGHENVKMVESEMGQIPRGWEIKCVGDFGLVITGKTPPKERPELFGEGIPFIKLPDMHGNIFVLDTVEHLSSLGQEYQSNKTLPSNSISVSCIGTAGIVVITTRPSQTNQQINSVVLNSIANREFLYFRLVDLKETINQYGANGATMVNLNKTKFEGLRLVLPPAQFLEQYHNAVSPMFECIKNLQQRNDTLRKARDFLLPKLVSGEIRVEEIETEAATQRV